MHVYSTRQPVLCDDQIRHASELVKDETYLFCFGFLSKPIETPMMFIKWQSESELHFYDPKLRRSTYKKLHQLCLEPDEHGVWRCTGYLKRISHDILSPRDIDKLGGSTGKNFTARIGQWLDSLWQFDWIPSFVLKSGRVQKALARRQATTDRNKPRRY